MTTTPKPADSKIEGALGGRSVVAIAHTDEKHRSQGRVIDLVQEVLAYLGGMKAFVHKGDTVLIKPNQTVFYSAEEGCTTDPLVVGAIIRLAFEAGAKHVQVGESSGGFFSSLDCMQITGVAAVAEREGAELIDLGSDATPNRVIQIPDGRFLKECPIPAPLLDADVIIDVPKAKNHHIEPISGALKNWVGAVNQNWRNHNHGDEEHIPRFMDIMTVTRPTLCIVDALIAGEGDGPIANLPRWCGCIIASADPVATDVTIAKLLGHDPEKLTFAKEAELRGLGTRTKVDYVGTPLEDVAFDAWEPHDGFDYLPINFLVGKGVTLAGTVGHVKSAIDSMNRRGELNQVIWLKGTPTIMIGETDDPNFEEHLKEGPYIVFDDASKPEYKNDSRVYFVSGHPVLQTALPELMKGLGVNWLGQTAMQWQQFERRGMHNLTYGSPARKAISIVKPLGIAGLAVAGIIGLSKLKKRFSKAGRSPIK
jgi:uncharacterized protein (DUF362 family)